MCEYKGLIGHSLEIPRGDFSLPPPLKPLALVVPLEQRAKTFNKVYRNNINIL